MPPRRANALGVGSAETPGAGSEFVNESPDRAGRPRRPPRKARRRVIAGGCGEEEQRRAAGCIGRPATGGDSFTDSELAGGGEVVRRRAVRSLVVALVLLPALAHAVGPTVAFTLPALHATPSVLGTLPFPCDLYFDGGTPGGGDGTLLDVGASIGLGTDIVRVNTAAVEDALDLLDGFGTTTAIYFFLSGPLDRASLPASPVLA